MIEDGLQGYSPDVAALYPYAFFAGDETQHLKEFIRFCVWEVLRFCERRLLRKPDYFYEFIGSSLLVTIMHKCYPNSQTGVSNRHTGLPGRQHCKLVLPSIYF